MARSLANKAECVELMNLNISDANKAIEAEDYTSAQISLENAAFWAAKASVGYVHNEH